MNSRDFWRGVVDGDGWLCETKDKYKYQVIGLSSTESTLLIFLKYIKLNNIVTETKPNKDKRHDVWGIDVRADPAKKIINLLYKNSSVYLDRKYKIYQSWCI
jgi:hypothetical protein